MTRTRRWVRRLSLVGATASAGVLAAALLAAPANADAPTQVGWWGDHPDPATPAGGIHVEVAPQQVLAYGAVLVMLPQSASATLTLKIAGTGGSGTLQACPTKSDSWKPGDAQSMSDAPGYDCSVHALQGLVSSDGTSVTFLVDGSIETTPGTLSLAIVPVRTTGAPAVGTDTGTDVTPPYFADIDKPDSSAFTVTGGSDQTTGSLQPAAPPPTGTGGGSTSGAASTAGGAGSVPASGPVPMPSGPTTTTVPAAPDAGNAPVVAQPGATTPSSSVLPAAASGTSSTTNRAHDAALGLLALLFLALATGSGGTPRMPRRIGGGTHRAGAQATAATAGGVPAAPAMVPGLAPRGLGRFAKPRTAPPRPLT